MESTVSYEKVLNDHVQKERAAVVLASKTGELLYDKGIELVLFRNHLLDRTVSELLNLHDYAKNVVGKEIDVFTSSELATEIYNMNLAPAKLDIGKLSAEWISEKAKYASKREFLDSKLAGFNVVSNDPIEPRDVVLYGFGRIGRLAARELITQAGKGQQLRLRAIVTRGATDKDIIKRAALMKNDSVHGAFKGTVEVDLEKRALVINGQIVQ
jgi:glyceraldehyde 3-phosphate dehydrogenase